MATHMASERRLAKKKGGSRGLGWLVSATGSGKLRPVVGSSSSDLGDPGDPIFCGAKFAEENWSWYCWWIKSCTKDDDYPITYRVLTIPGGAGFQPSTVVLGWCYCLCFCRDNWWKRCPCTPPLSPVTNQTSSNTRAVIQYMFSPKTEILQTLWN